MIPIYFLENSILKLIIAPLLALPVYLGLSYLFKISEFFVFLQKIKEILLSRK
jgi:hypothetical protein